MRWSTPLIWAVGLASAFERLMPVGVDWAVVATAHPAKFPEVVEPLVGAEVTLPPALAAMLARPSHAQTLADDAGALRELLRKP